MSVSFATIESSAYARSGRDLSLSQNHFSGEGRVTFTTKNIKPCRASISDCRDLVKVIVALHESWLNQDVESYVAMTTSNVVRMSEKSGDIQHGQDTVREKMLEEWNFFERGKKINIDIRISNATLSVTGDTATATYQVEVVGGRRWDFDDQALYFQAFVKENGGWKLAHQTDSWNLDLEQRGTSGRSVEFDYVYPVKDLSRAVQFYRPILGEPEYVLPTRASFRMGRARFFLDSSGLHGFAKIQAGLPNGYAEVHVRNLKSEVRRLKKRGVTFLTGIQKRGTDFYILVTDPAQNVFVLVEREATIFGSEAPTKPVITAEPGTSPEIIATVRKLMSAWQRTDRHTLVTHLGKNFQWFDDTRSKKHGIVTSIDAIQWDGYHRSNAGLRATMEIYSLRAKPFGAQTIVSYEMVLTGIGDHPFRERSMVTHVFKNNQVVKTFIVASDATRARALSLDYVGHPVVKLREAEKFYSEIMNFGSPYQDEDYRGYWSSASVYGIYITDPESDGLPRKRQTNGYVSFWVKSVHDTYEYLKSHGSDFPVIGSIGLGKSEINHLPGYIQIYTTDSEGNGVIFTEYPGK
ncbi:MAG: DUF4440 domain-containing protein [bacterium]|nr:DUF4440 domain-containing protein [bacterium]